MADEDGTGIADPSQISEYVQDTYGESVSSMSPADRAEQLMAEVNQNLASEGVPAVYWQWGATGNTNGSFDASAWTMELNEVNFTDPDGEYDTTVLTARHQDVAATIYHEARHAEQCYRCCRERIGLGATPLRSTRRWSRGARRCRRCGSSRWPPRSRSSSATPPSTRPSSGTAACTAISPTSASTPSTPAPTRTTATSPRKPTPGARGTASPRATTSRTSSPPDRLTARPREPGPGGQLS